jgi:DNA-binding IclR family transcriptional regulator
MVENNARGRPRADALYKGEAVLRAAKTLSCFTAERPRWTLNELSARTGTPKATLQGILNTLVAHGMLRRDLGEGYRLGFAWLRLGALRRNQSDARTVALPLMQEIRDRINETVVLSMRVGDQRVHIDYVESTHPIRRLTQIGSSGPLHVGATGLALLSTLSQGESAAYLERAKPMLTPDAPDKIERELALIRAEGHAVAIGSVNPDLAAVAAAVRIYAGESIALTISCPLERFDPAMRRDCADLVQAAVIRLSSKLGSHL